MAKKKRRKRRKKITLTRKLLYIFSGIAVISFLCISTLILTNIISIDISWNLKPVIKQPEPTAEPVQEAEEKKNDIPVEKKTVTKTEEKKQTSAVVETDKHEKPGGKLAIVIDDAGYSIDELKPFLKFPGKLSIAVLPQLPHSAEAAKLVLEAGKELLLHQPMEPEGTSDPGPGAIFISQTKEEIEEILLRNFASVPGARGMNNHMGSKFTSNPEKMDIVFGFLKERHLYFLDSKTTPQSVGRETAIRIGLPLLQRHIFLDNEPDRESISLQLEKGIEVVLKNRYAVVIGHVQNSAVLEVLYEQRDKIIRENYAFSGLSEIFGK